MNGLILAAVLNWTFLGLGLPPVEAELTGGYQIGPAYMTCSILTRSTPVGFANFRPENVTWDFRVGAEWRGFDLCLSRVCTHDVFAVLPESSGWRIVLSYDSREANR